MIGIVSEGLDKFNRHQFLKKLVSLLLVVVMILLLLPFYDQVETFAINNKT
jgi:hypothetical protein